MLIRNGSDCLEIVVTERVSDHLPAAGDMQLAISVRAGGFAGAGWTWIEASTLRAFVTQLRELEARRRGSAEVQSISPEQFRLCVWNTDRAGHMALTGRLARGEQSLEFAFGFCPSLLPAVLAAFEAIAEGSVEQGSVLS